MIDSWMIGEVRGLETGIAVTLSVAEPTASLVVTLCDNPLYNEERPTFCICWPVGQWGPNGTTPVDIPDAVIPEVEIDSGVVAVAFDRQEFVGTNWPKRWTFMVLHERWENSDPREPPTLLLLASGSISLPDLTDGNVVCSVEVS